jgi:hypothetical protein
MVFGLAEVILVLRTLKPATLTFRFALLAACRLGAVALMMHITRIWRIEIAAAEALALNGNGTLHRQTQKFESLLPQDHSFEAEQNPEKAE